MIKTVWFCSILHPKMQRLFNVMILLSLFSISLHARGETIASIFTNDNDSSTVIRDATVAFLNQLTDDEKKSIHTVSDFNHGFERELSKLNDAEQKYAFSPENIGFLEKTHPQVIKAFEETLSLDARYESEIYRKANRGSADPKYDVTPESVEARSYELIQVLEREVSEDQTLSEESKSKVLKKLKRTKPITQNTILRETNPLEQFYEFVFFESSCENFSVQNAFSITDTNSSDLIKKVGPRRSGIRYAKVIGVKPGATPFSYFIVCPGLITTLGKLKYKQPGLDFVLAHEMGHIVINRGDDPSKKIDRSLLLNDVDQSILKEHQNFLDCIQNHYGDQFKSFTALATEFKKTASSSMSGDYQAAATLQETVYRDLIEKYKTSVGSVPNALAAHSPELIADYWGTRVVAEEALANHDVPTDALIEAYLNYIKISAQSFALGFYPDGDEGTHPSNFFRIDNFLRNPTFRELSNTPHSATEPWCSI